VKRMQIKKILILTAPLFLLALTALPVYAQKSGNSGNEQFFLFNAVYNSATIQTSKTTIFLEKRLFKIDRKSGDTWMLIDQIRDGQDIKYWQKINSRVKKK